MYIHKHKHMFLMSVLHVLYNSTTTLAIKSMQRTIFRQIARIGARQFSYKPVKRPNFSEGPRTTRKTNQNNDPAVTGKNVDLTKQLRAKILATGPITVADYMREVLTNPQCGYYMDRDVFGREGDFITSPEISQIFGELVAIWIYSEWQKMGSPEFQLVELGPGRGTLLRDIIKVLTKFQIGASLSFHLVEISPHLSKLQAERLCYSHEVMDSDNELFYQKGKTASGIEIYWYRRLEDVPQKFSVVVAHEFFDALPVHKFQLAEGQWKEVLIDICDKPGTDFRFVISKNQTPVSKIFKPLEGETRLTLEYSLETERIIDQLAQRLESHGGIGLIMDYGHFGDKTDTFRAFKNHKLHNPLKDPGSADLTADIDFRLIKAVAERNNQTVCCGPVEQGTFLKRMQGDHRLENLLKTALPENRANIKSGYEMLTHPEQMGSRFKFVSLFPAIMKDHIQKFPVSGFH